MDNQADIQPTTSEAPAEGGSNPGAEALKDSSASEPSGDWLSGFDDAQREKITKRGWKSPQEMFRSYEGAEKVLSDTNRKPFPGEHDDITQWEGWADLGRPETPEGYSELVKRPDLPEGVTYDEELEAKFFAAMHETGAPPHMVQKALDTFVAREMAAFEAAQAQSLADKQEFEKQMRGEFGSPDQQPYKEALDYARRGYKALGLDDAALEQLGANLGSFGLVKGMAKLGRMMGENGSLIGEGGDLKGRTESLKSELAALDAKFVSAGKNPAITWDHTDMERRTSIVRELAVLDTQ